MLRRFSNKIEGLSESAAAKAAPRRAAVAKSPVVSGSRSVGVPYGRFKAVQQGGRVRRVPAPKRASRMVAGEPPRNAAPDIGQEELDAVDLRRTC